MLELCLSLYLDLGIGYDRYIDEGKNPQSVIRVSCEFQPNWFVEIDHHSSVFNGFPFNNKEEDLAHQVSVVYRYDLKKLFK